MTQSTGADAPESTEEKTVTTADLARGWDYPDPEGEVAGLEEFMGVKGPFTPTEAAELDRRMRSQAPEDRFPGYQESPFILSFPQGEGPHGPGCQCEGDPELEALLSMVSPEIAEALFGRTPAEERTGVSDAEAAMAQELGTLAKRIRDFGKDSGAVGVYTASFMMDPVATASRLLAASQKVKKQAKSLADTVKHLQEWLPQVKGTRTQATMDFKDGVKGLLVFQAPDTSIQTWAPDSTEKPPADWKPLFI